MAPPDSKTDLNIEGRGIFFALPSYEQLKSNISLDYRPYLACLQHVAVFRETLPPIISNLNNRLFLGSYDSRLFNSADMLKDLSDKDPKYDHFKDILVILNFHQKHVVNIKRLHNISMSIFLTISLFAMVYPNDEDDTFKRPIIFFMLLAFCYKVKSYFPNEMKSFNRQKTEDQILSLIESKRNKRSFPLFTVDQKEYLRLVQERLVKNGVANTTYCIKKSKTLNKCLI